jgi:hypothetical protein
MRKKIEIVRQQVDHTIEKVFTGHNRIPRQEESRQEEEDSMDRLSRLVRYLEKVSKF